jgi:hypothetical protein
MTNIFHCKSARAAECGKNSARRSTSNKRLLCEEEDKEFAITIKESFKILSPLHCFFFLLLGVDVPDFSVEIRVVSVLQRA